MFVSTLFSWKKAYIICYDASFGNRNIGIHIAYIMQCNKQDDKPLVGNFYY